MPAMLGDGSGSHLNPNPTTQSPPHAGFFLCRNWQLIKLGPAPRAASQTYRPARRAPVAGGRWQLTADRWPVAGGRGSLAGGWWPVAVGRWLVAGGRWLVAGGS